MPASKKLQASDAKTMLKAASKLMVAKGKKRTDFDVTNTVSADAVAAMLGPTGNLRAPTIRVGKQLIVGYNEALFEEIFG